MPLAADTAGPDQDPDSSGPRCATVTMMLADRMMRSEWSVDDEHFFETNTMNVWQTLEFLSGVNLRKRYHYEGYNDTENVVRTLTPSWRRDNSFVEKNASAPGDEPSGAASTATTTAPNGKYHPHERAGGGRVAGPEHDYPAALDAERLGQRRGEVRGGSAVRVRGKSATRRKRRAKKPADGPSELDPEYALSPADFTDLIKCNFNLPRISAALERLMGTNVVRLTDRKYMKELRDRIEDDYRTQLQKRIVAREEKEIERERILIIEGKSDVIPVELAEDPIFVVNKAAQKEILKQRSKLKTNREKNSERLKLQGVKWERERLEHEEEERVRLEILRERIKEQKELEERYKAEDAERCMDLLRIESEDWRACEQKLKEFLDAERRRMKERSWRVPSAYTSDPKDIKNIVRARQKFRETEQRIRQDLEVKMKTDKTITPVKELSVKAAVSRLSKLIADEEELMGAEEQEGEMKEVTSVEMLMATEQEDERIRRKFNDDASDTSIETELGAAGSTISESRAKHAAELEAELESDVQMGLLISKDQYSHLRYEEEKIMALRKAADIRELYRLAEEIIIGEHIDEEIIEEEVEEEHAATVADDDDDN